jgi:hypothetical protein
LLSGAYLKEARLPGKTDDIVLQSADAQEFVRRSDKGWVAQQKVPLRQRLYLLIMAGGAVGFASAFGITYVTQVVNRSLFLVLVLIALIPGMIGAAVYSAGILIPVLREPGLMRQKPVLAGMLAGGAGFTVMLAFTAILASVKGLFPWLMILVEGLLWGFVAGAGIAWALLSPRPAWQTWGLVGLASGLSLVAGEILGHAFVRPNASGTLAGWQVFLAGAIVPLAILLAARLGRGQAAYRDLLAS